MVQNLTKNITQSICVQFLPSPVPCLLEVLPLGVECLLLVFRLIFAWPCLRFTPTACGAMVSFGFAWTFLSPLTGRFTLTKLNIL